MCNAPDNMMLEACVESLRESVSAWQNGAGRLELCSSLHLDGLTPSAKLVEQVINTVPIPVKVMIRNRPGNFVFSEKDVREMEQSIDKLKTLPVAGIVIGALTESRSLDMPVLDRLSRRAARLPVTIHKAIDHCHDIPVEFSRIVQSGRYSSVLTSGGQGTAIAGAEMIRKMIALAKGKVMIIAAGKVTAENLDEVHRLTAAGEYHGRRIVS